MILIDLLFAMVLVFVLEGALAAGLTFMPRSMAQACCRAPAVDGIVALLTWVPWLIVGLALGWPGVFVTVVTQIGLLYAWIFAHESYHLDERQGPRIVQFLNNQVGHARNHTALIVTLLALPVLWGVRLAEMLVYPLLIVLLDFPRYKQGDWVNLSRYKFDGLVGHDLIWCLYCDWMTGVYALAGEMLRNVESFWCPIRFDDAKKCENCRLDFPDIDGGWVRPDGDMDEVLQVMEEKYGDGQRTWFGHPTRLTVEGKTPPPPEANTPPEAEPSKPPATPRVVEPESIDMEPSASDDDQEPPTSLPPM